MSYRKLQQNLLTTFIFCAIISYENNFFHNCHKLERFYVNCSLPIMIFICFLNGLSYHAVLRLYCNVLVGTKRTKLLGAE
jgi:hypothetical protein